MLSTQMNTNWKDIQDERPPVETDVLFLLDYGKCAVGKLLKTGAYLVAGGMPIRPGITHWCPLPELPK